MGCFKGLFLFFWGYLAYTRTALKLVASQQTPLFSTHNIIGSLKTKETQVIVLIYLDLQL